jgi:hypothetical protein
MDGTYMNGQAAPSSCRLEYDTIHHHDIAYTRMVLLPKLLIGNAI